MSVIFQIGSILISFLFGFFFYYGCKIHFSLIFYCKTLVQFVLSVVYMLDMVLLYVCLLYHFNEGILHLYFVLCIALGYFLAMGLHKNVKRIKKHLPFLVKKNK